MSNSGQSKLRAGVVSPIGIIFLVVATAAPLTSVATTLPVAVGFGNGVGAPGTYLLVTAVLALFAVGYAAMSTRITNAGAFYAYISAGFGRPAGMAAGLVAVLSYNVLSVFVAGYVGFFAKQTFEAELGVDLPWWLYAAVALTIVVVLGIRGIELSIYTLGFLLIIETALLVVFDLVALVKHGTDALPAEAFSPGEVFSGTPGLAILFAVTCFLGFEATAILGEEAKDPKRTVPRATYGAIAFVGGLYIISSWLVVGVGGGMRAGELAGADPGVYVFDIFSGVLGGWSLHVTNWLVLTSQFAVLMAIHNMSSRYLMALGRARVLPSALARTHREFDTPWVAALVQAGFTSVVVLGYILADADPYLDMGNQMVGVGVLGVVCLMAACSFSVPFYFARQGALRPWHHVVAPVAAGCALIYFAYLIVDNYALISGSTSSLVNRLPLVLLVAAAVGFAIGMQRRHTSEDLDVLTVR